MQDDKPKSTASEKFEKLRVSEPKTSAAGLASVASAMKQVVGKMGVVRGTKGSR
jgi:hypothetical protein